MHSQAGGSFLARFCLVCRFSCVKRISLTLGFLVRSQDTPSAVCLAAVTHTHIHVSTFSFCFFPPFLIGSINTQLSRDAIENSILLSFVGRCSWSGNWADHRLCLEPGHEQYKFLLLWLQADL